MYVSLNMQLMTVMHKHPSINVVSNLVYLEAPKSLCHISTIDDCLKDKTDLEVKMLYRNTIGTDPKESDFRKKLLYYIAARVEVTDVHPEELAKFAASVNPTDKKVYKYIKGQFSSFLNPTLLDKPIEGPRHYQDPPPATYAKKPSILDDLKDDDPLPEDVPAVKREPRQARNLAQPSDRPKAGSTTGKVWDIADEISQTISDPKALRKAVIERCTQEGINSSTASVQFGKWKNSR